MERGRNTRHNRQGSRNPRQQVQDQTRNEGLTECNALRREVARLKDMLAKGRANCPDKRIASLSKELEETKLTLETEKAQKELSMKNEKKYKRELNKLKREDGISYFEQEDVDRVRAEFMVVKRSNGFLREEMRMVLDAHHDISEKYETDIVAVRQNIDHMEKELLKQYEEELQAAHALIEEKFLADLQLEKQRQKRLQEELEKISVSYREVSQRYETVVTVTVDEPCMQPDSIPETPAMELSNEAPVLEEELCQHPDSPPEAQNMDVPEEVPVLEEKLCQHPDSPPEAQNIEVLEEVPVLEEKLCQQPDSPPEGPIFEVAEKVVVLEPNITVLQDVPFQTHSSCQQPDSPPETPTIKVPKEVQVQREKPSQQRNSPAVVSSIDSGIELLEVIEITKKRPASPKKASTWKRFRHSLGLRKPQRWKKEKDEE